MVCILPAFFDTAHTICTYKYLNFFVFILYKWRHVLCIILKLAFFPQRVALKLGTLCHSPLFPSLGLSASLKTGQNKTER